MYAPASGLAGKGRFEGTAWLEAIRIADHQAMSCWPCFASLCFFPSVQLTRIPFTTTCACVQISNRLAVVLLALYRDMHSCHAHTYVVFRYALDQRTTKQEGISLKALRRVVVCGSSICSCVCQVLQFWPAAVLGKWRLLLLA